MPDERAGTIRSERDRFRKALLLMDERLPHHGCGACGPCIAHEALYGHTYQRGGRCCWPAELRRHG